MALFYHVRSTYTILRSPPLVHRDDVSRAGADAFRLQVSHYHGQPTPKPLELLALDGVSVAADTANGPNISVVSNVFFGFPFLY